PYISTTNSSSPGSMYMYTASGAYNYIVTPEFDVSIPINSLSAFFKLYKTSAAYNITVGVMSDPTDATTFDSITNLSPTSTSTWQIFGVDFTNYTGIGQHIAFKVQGYGATNSMYIDDLMINTTPSCSIPTGLTDYDSLATPNSITLDWDGTDDANVLSWIVEYKPIDETTWQSEDAFAHPFVLTGLQSSIVYQVRLYAICSSGDTTYATNTINVGMPCEAITTIPWNEGFEGVWFVAYGLNTGTHPWCWTNINGGASTSYLWRKTTTSSDIHSGSGALQMYAANTTGQLGDWFISPTISLTGNERLRFWAKGYSTYTDILSVKILDVTTNGIVDAEADTSLFVDIMPNTIIPASDWIEYEVNLNQFTGDYQIAFVRNTTGGYYLNIDDVSITDIPACARPTAINTGYVIDEEIELSWIPGNTGDAAWYLYWKAASATDYDSVYVTQQPYVLQNLTANTTYNIYLRTDCLTELSEATNPISIKTALCAPVTTFPYTEGFDSLGATAGAFPPCWARPVIYSTYPKTSTEASRVHSAPASLEIHSAVGSPTYAVTPPMGEDINTLRVTFWAMAESTTSSGTIEVGVMSDPNNLLTFESVQVIQPTNTSYNQYEVIFAGTTLNGLNKSIAFRQNTVSAIYYYWIDDVVVDYIPACSYPALVEVSNISTTSADVTWAPANATDNAWWLYYKTAAATSYDSIYITGTPSYSFTTLTANTLYDIYLRTDCGAELSEQTVVTSFRTSCGEITSLPFTENFDSYTTGTSVYIPCWERINTYSSDRPYINSTNHSAPGSLYFYATSGTYNIAITPAFDISIPINTLKARFFYRNNNSTDLLEVGVITSTTDASTFVPIDTIIAPTEDTWAEYEVSFDTYTGIGQYIAFRNAYTTANAYAYVDDLIIDIIPSCARPDSIYATNITQTDAEIGIVAGDISDFQWKLYYRLAGTSTWTDVDVFTFPYQMTGLSANTEYEVYVTTLCNDGSYSDGSTILTFRTPCDNILTIPYT
ncbi:MAG: choice-of-anchor J domain-containing protein, partial [Bacteroidales bacterium]|nr:choice-of-anchor J domain-containing protein [Bacteroidales bacterium]